MMKIFGAILVILISGSIAVTIGDAYGETVGNTVLIFIIVFWISVFIYQYSKKDK